MPKVDMADTGVMESAANILARCRNEADTHLAEGGRNSAGRDRAKHIEVGAAVNGAEVTGPAVIGTAVTGAAETGAAVTGMAVIGTAAADSSLSADLVTRTTGVGIHIGVGAILTLTRTTAIIPTGTILRTGTSMTIAPYQEGDSSAPDLSVILFNNQSSGFTGVAAICFTTSLKSPLCSCVSITLPHSSLTISSKVTLLRRMA
jgi:hypothetical protein